MSKPSFVYVLYINAPADRVWRGIVDPEFTRVYWMHENVSDWEVGSRWEHRQVEAPHAPWKPEPGKVDIAGEVLESDRPRRLVLSWAPPEHQGSAEKTSRLAFDIEALDWPGGPWVRLTVSHTEMEQEMRDSVAFGWPAAMSVMKTLVEQASRDPA